MTDAMIPRALKASFLLLAFVGGGIGLPGLDAALYHRVGDARSAPTGIIVGDHVVVSHAQSCILAAAWHAPRHTAPLPPVPWRSVDVVWSGPAAPPPGLPCTDRLSLQQSRAPPLRQI